MSYGYAMKNGLSLNIASVPTLAPSGVFPSLALNFLNTETLSSLVTFTRASGATRTNSAGTLVTMTDDQPRFDYDPSTLASKGLLIEEQRTNLLTYSEQFDNAAWTKSNTAISGTNTVLAPDNTLSGEEVRDGTASGLHNVFQAVSVVAGTTYAFSCYLQNVDRQFASLAVSTGTSQYAGAKFNLVAGAAGSTAAAGGGWSVVSSSITAVNNGWYRCTLTLVAGNTASANIRIGLATDGTTFTAAGSGLESYLGTDLKIALWGAQVEAGAFATSYISTTTAAATRAVDVAVMTGTNFSSWYNASEGTIVAKWIPGQSGVASRLVQICTSNTNTIQILQATTGVPQFQVINTTVTQVSLATGTAVTVGSVMKVGGAYALNNFAKAANGGDLQTDAVGTVPSGLDIAIIGGSFAATQVLNGHMQQISYYPTRLPNATLAALTV